jgi:branched-chain amino acid transport system permease protein
MSRINAGTIAFLVISLIFIALPFWTTAVMNDWLIGVAKLIILAVSWNIAANAGLISLGQSAFWGVGGYGAVLVANKFGVPILTAVLVSAVVGACLGAFLAVITGKLRGIFFAISALALSEGLRVIAVMTPGFTGGGEGVYVAQQLRPEPHFVTMLMIVCALVVIAIAWALSRTSYQFACRAMRANEPAAQMLGVNPVRFRVMVLSLSGAMSALAGGVNAWYTGFLDPNIAFDLDITILAQIAPILGGIYTLTGPVVGAFATACLSDAFRQWLGTEGLSLLIYGLALIIAILFLPEGIWGAVKRIGILNSRGVLAGGVK